jgi:hypothetical protein
MSVGQVFIIIAAALFFLTAINVQAIPNGAMWGWFFFAVGWLTSGIPLWRVP